MDPLSQSLFGALSAQTASKKRDIKVATICGITGGITPDIDILIRSNSDPLLSVEFHRHFTHSIFFAPIGSCLLYTSPSPRDNTTSRMPSSA